MIDAIEMLRGYIIPQYEQDIDRVGISKAQNELNKKWVTSLKEALLALEQKEKLKKWLESNISQLLELEDKLKDIDETYYASAKLRRVILEEVLKELEEGSVKE